MQNRFPEVRRDQWGTQSQISKAAEALDEGVERVACEFAPLQATQSTSDMIGINLESTAPRRAFEAGIDGQEYYNIMAPAWF